MNPALCQWFTPQWAAEALVEKYFPDLGANDLVLEPSCGSGAFLSAIPPGVPAVGVEVDPVLAAATQAATGRPVVVGDFRLVRIPGEPTVVVGNPPFKADLIQDFLARCHQLLPDGARAGFILPAYYLQTSSSVARLRDQWSLSVDLLPRNLFPRLSMPLMFTIFRKGRERGLVGLALYGETDEVEALHAAYRALLARVSGSAWGAAVAEAMRHVGGEASLETIYRAMEGRRPTQNSWWRERVRAVLQQHYRRVGPARYAFP